MDGWRYGCLLASMYNYKLQLHPFGGLQANEYSTHKMPNQFWQAISMIFKMDIFSNIAIHALIQAICMYGLKKRHYQQDWS